ncbi:MAG: 1-(5-phosphoribosyl)-5-[(5-phosphoribosylamino)methylideneamino] imidazole-4-carboxamide isomerase [Wendovervirus sonii]|uniref:1-(5-phosphoribosyl)-5-[(5-phosphoribosylamino)methylideneamino]imidazole-4-carboxamideisomerase n=1 Tax=phage Lak_Megaphage_Sonny TaxID=3109229 RepID=A0ABZ0Z5P2_9CAUD|nr:MAG: 1-(5-phosphoribosyl)-5-[(5-phosphoribosylamino)methylideneamino] imidazole-4-carboxamide isomerase [phage Lak_Megaphage_Sonny]
MKANIIPAMDLLYGRVVRLYQGDYGNVVFYKAYPIEVARHFKRQGYEWIHIVDLAAARCKTDEELNAYLESETRKKINALLVDIHVLGLKIELGGGIRNKSFCKLVKSGIVDRLSLGSKAFTDPNFYNEMVDECGKDHISLGLDLCNEKIAIHGWENESNITWQDFLINHANNIRHIVCTDISKDGTMSGCNIDLYRKILSFMKEHNINAELIASGGVVDTNLNELYSAGIKNAIIGKALLNEKFV